MADPKGDAGILVIVPCGQQKLWDRVPNQGPVEAQTAYTSPVFRLNRQFAEQFADAWMILSAKYGFIAPTFMVPCPYNVTFNRKSSEPVSVETLREQVRHYELCRHRTVIGLGGKEYREAITHAFARCRVCLIFPFAGLRIGEAMRAVKQAITKNALPGQQLMGLGADKCPP